MHLVPTMTVSSLKSLNWSLQVQYVPKVMSWVHSTIYARYVASRRWSHFPLNDSPLLQRQGPEAWKLQRTGRCKDVTSSLASHWDLLSGCLEVAWAHCPLYAICQGRPSCHIRWGPLWDSITDRAAFKCTFTVIAHHSLLWMHRCILH